MTNAPNTFTHDDIPSAAVTRERREEKKGVRKKGTSIFADWCVRFVCD
jgi:hypothetical protein